jgi:hypothetical protein
MLIELIGPPGSGKSTIARLLDRHLSASRLPYLSSAELLRLDHRMGERSLKQMDVARRLLALGGLLWRFPGLVTRVWLLALLHGPPLGRRLRRARRLLGHFMLLHRLRDVAGGRLVVLDEGLLQRLWSLNIESTGLRGEPLCRAVLAEYHAEIAPLAVSLEIADEEATTRVFNRQSKGRFNELAAPARRAAFDRWLGYHRRLVALLPQGAIVATIDTRGEPAAVAERLAVVVAELARERSIGREAPPEPASLMLAVSRLAKPAPQER